MYLSLGGGVQSSTLLLMSFVSEIELFKAAIFADTQFEPREVYDHLDYLKNIVGDKIPILTATKGNLKKAVLDGIAKGDFPALPFHMRQGKNVALMQRRCTVDYKIVPIQRKLRELGETKTSIALGISLDEVIRAKPSRVKWCENVFPLLDKKMRREDCIYWLGKHGFKIPPKSACLGCPFHSEQYWGDMKTQSPQEFAEMVEFDEKIRNLPNMTMKAYLHRSAQPLVQAVNDAEMQKKFDFQEECEGHCGV